MPLYEYRCQSCGKKEEQLESFQAPTEHDCGYCGTAKGMRRQISLASFALVGGGWSAEEYGKGKASKEASEPAAAKPAGCCGGGCACHSGAQGH